MSYEIDNFLNNVKNYYLFNIHSFKKKKRKKIKDIKELVFKLGTSIYQTFISYESQIPNPILVLSTYI